MGNKNYHLLAVEDIDDLIKANEDAGNPNSKFNVVLSDAYVAAYKSIRVLLVNAPSAEDVWNAAQRIDSTHADQQYNSKGTLSDYLQSINKSEQ